MNEESSLPSAQPGQAAQGTDQGRPSGDLAGLAKQLGGFLRRSASVIQQDVQQDIQQDMQQDVSASLASDQPVVANKGNYPDTIWGYLEGDYHLDLRYMPTRGDRDRLDSRRQQLWDYFFRIDPNDVGKPQQRELAQRKNRRNSEVRNYEQRSRVLEERRNSLERERQLLKQILDIEAALHHSKPASPEPLKGADLLPSFLRKTAPATEAPSQLEEQKQRDLEAQLKRLRGELVALQQRGQTPSDGDSQPVDPLPNRTPEMVEQQAVAATMELSRLQQGLIDTLKALDDRIESLERSIEALRAQLPQPPSDDQMRQWLQDDLDELKRQAQFRVAAGTRLQSIASYDRDTLAERVTDMISIVSPGRIQDMTRLPPTYTPPQIGSARRRLDQAVAAINVNSFQLAKWIQPKTVADRGKHFLAKRLQWTNQGINILYGVYYVDLLMVLDDMMVLHSFFFDYISGTTAAERTTEVYFSDIVALETSHEYRAIPLRYTDDERDTEDPDAFFILEDVPVFSLVLSNGDRHTVSFINEAYLRGLLKHIEDEKLSRFGSNRQEVDRYVRQSVGESLRIADDAIRVLRAQVRRHKMAHG